MRTAPSHKWQTIPHIYFLLPNPPDAKNKSLGSEKKAHSHTASGARPSLPHLVWIRARRTVPVFLKWINRRKG